MGYSKLSKNSVSGRSGKLPKALLVAEPIIAVSQNETLIDSEDLFTLHSVTFTIDPKLNSVSNNELSEKAIEAKRIFSNYRKNS